MEQVQEEQLNTRLSSIYRKMGSCILRLQQYELLIKGMITDQEISGYVGEVKANQTQRNAEIGTKTLGQLVGELTGSYLSTPTTRLPGETEDSHELDPARAHFRATFQMELNEDEYQRTIDGLKKLVGLRNELVHHFLERFDLQDDLGCHSAEIYLDEVYLTINERFSELRSWAESMINVRKAAAEHMATPEFHDFFVYGVIQGQEVDWPNTPIIHQLLTVERNYHEDGWANLAKAIEIVRATWTDLTPKKYNCSSWRHVLHESGLFKTEKRINTDTGVNQVWYRSKSPESQE